MSDGTLLFWSPEGQVTDAIDEELPSLKDVAHTPSREPLLVRDPGAPVATADAEVRTVAGLRIPISEATPVLAALEAHADVSDTVRCWSLCAKLALELAARARAVPTVVDGHARWRALLSREQDRRRFEIIVDALPPAARAAPARRGRVTRMESADHVVRSFLDAVIDVLYRRDEWPGPARGWVLELAESLRGSRSEFAPRDARHQAIPDLLIAWSRGEEADLKLAFRIDLPDEAIGATRLRAARATPGPAEAFHLRLLLHPPGQPQAAIPLAPAWTSREPLTIAGRTYGHPAHNAIVALARAHQLYPPLAACLEGPVPADLEWTATETWAFLDKGAPRLEEAGFEVILPEEFSAAGTRRIRARMRLGDPVGPNGKIDLRGVLAFQWEVVLGDIVLTGADFADLLAMNSPIVRFRGDWVLLDPRELAVLPKGLPEAGTLPAPEALRAVLAGEHNGIPVVADDRLALILEAVREPPPQPPPRRLEATLRPYQERGYAWLSTLGELGLGACLADDMGLGKTVQLIAHILRRRERGARAPSLVVCPTSVLGNWQRELRRFAPTLRVGRYHGLQRNFDAAADKDVVITTYGLLVRDTDEFSAIDWDVVALDEAQSIKNPSSKRAGSARRLKARHRVALTGTPVENRLDELWSIMEFLVPGLLGPRATFQRRVAMPIERFGDEEIAHRLRLGVAPFLLRRLKTDPNVISDLPEKIETNEFTPLTAEQASLYREVVDEAMNDLTGLDGFERRGQIFKMITALKQVCNHPEHYLRGDGGLEGRSGKMERCIDLVESIVERGERALIFTQYTEMGELLKEHLEDIMQEDIPFLHGSVSVGRREEMVKDFQEDPDSCPILIISLRAGGTGLNLTAATHVIHYDRWWNPAVEDQATDRAYRIGQDRRVQVHKLITQGTLEERIDLMLEEKRALADSVVSGSEQWVTELDDDALRKLVLLGDDAVVA